MKKLGLLISMILMVTIGGVYATWYYASESQKMTDAHQHISIGLTGTVNDSSYGTYALNINTNVSMWVDPLNEAEGSHTTALYFGSYADKVLTKANRTDVIATITYTPGEYVPTVVTEKGVITKWNLESSVAVDEWKYDGKQIFNTIDNTVFKIHPVGTAGENCWTKTGDGKFTYSITVEMLDDLLTLNEIELDTAAKHKAYGEALAGGKIGLRVADGRDFT